MKAQVDSASSPPEKMLIADLAYNHFVRSGYVNGNDLQHWFDAEKEINKTESERESNQIKSSDDALHHMLARPQLLQP